MNDGAFYIVDVFAEERYAGNQLAVFRDAAVYSPEQMQRIAKEMHFSETTFILSDDPRDGGYDVRIFTPEEELPFAGHPTLGTAFIIQRMILGRPIDRITLNLKVGRIPVKLHYGDKGVDMLWMKQVAPTTGSTFERGPLARVLGLDEDEIDERFPIEEVSTGVPFIIVPLKTLAVLRKARVARDAYFELIEDTAAKAILVFAPEAHQPENDLSVRVFADYYGVPEDPATGAANGCLAGYLVKNRFFGEASIDRRAEQGYEIGRPSRLLLKAEEKDGEIEVNIGGKVILIAEGRLLP